MATVVDSHFGWINVCCSTIGSLVGNDQNMMGEE